MHRSVRRSRPPGLALVATFVIAVAACSASPAAAPTASPSSATPVTSATPAAPSSPVPSASPATPPSPVEAGPPERDPVTFESASYGYRAFIPADLVGGSAIPASRAWDGIGQINSDGPDVDRLPLAGSRLAFVYGAPTDLPIASYATEGQRLKASWHGCPATPDTAIDTTFDGTPARLHAFDCGGLRVLSLFVVRDGQGLVVNELAPPGDRSAIQGAFERLVAGWTWRP